MEDTVFSRNDTSIKENNTIEKNVPGDVDEHLPEMTLIRNVMPSMEELNAVEKDFFKRLEKPGDSDKHLQRMALNRNDRPCTKEQSVVEKDESKRLDEVKAVEDLGVSEREDEVEGDEDLQGVNEKQEEESKVGKISTKSGKSKRKELHSTTKVNALSDSWDDEERGVILQVYELLFTSQCNDEKPYSHFAFFIKSVLDIDITDTDIDLFLTSDKIVKAKLLPSGKMTLNSTQLRNAKDFQEIIFNGIYGNLRNRKIITETKNLWCSSYMYLLLPLESDKSGAIGIDWKCIETCAASAREFKLLSTISKENHSTIVIDNTKKVPMAGSTHLYSQGESEILILARGICESSNLIDKAVVTVHNGMIYQVVSIIHDATAKSPFPSKKDSKPRYDSYSDYFQKMHGKKLKHLNQPLLMVKHVEQLYNFLVKDQQKPIVNEGKFVELPPELCLNLGVSSSVMRSLYLVPSVMHRLTSLMLASQLHKAIREERSDCPPVPASLIMEALTSRKCSECFSYERLELLGDSFLKFVISQHLFMKYENEDEGQLSARRAEAVCNKTLHRLALDHNLEGYIIDELFDVCKWVAPGLFFRSIVPCTCNPGDPNSLRMGEVCDKGHRWIYSKTISDVVEALIGAHLVGGGTNAALEFMRWMNMEVDIEDKSVKIAFNHSFAHPNAFKTERLNTSLDELQLLLRYHFENPCLLMEALTHASINERGRCSYQRLEFLGDSVLDLLITQYLYSTYQELSPGTLSDLRQVAVNNENFAQAIVKHGIHNYIHHNSDELRNQIAKFVEDFERCKGGDCQFISFGGGMRAPKVLGDLIESISGAILVDTQLKPNVVWDKIYPILSPIVTPENVVPQPLRELYELCDQQHYKYNWKPIIKTGNVYAATIQIQLEDFNIYGEGSNKNSKLAMTKAAIDALAQLRVKGIGHGRHIFVQSTIDTIGNEAPRLSNLIAQEKMIIASSPQIDSEEVDQCCGGQVDQEKNLLYSSKSMQGDLNLS
ncbi:endoribonuclease Dicer homolog 3 isoform X2 [Cryptomeria japonica]|uniref:endoribonuclease Dicer homolog 3 isoform X2 n=1 Tax=Cryptomeria japonica TaxID=3369 RepID=UPI0027DA26D4|nr:endoribonuclease Dicer homolog 3 isoform X2 [Cryptomeria japonica]